MPASQKQQKSSGAKGLLPKKRPTAGFACNAIAAKAGTQGFLPEFTSCKGDAASPETAECGFEPYNSREAALRKEIPDESAIFSA